MSIHDSEMVNRFIVESVKSSIFHNQRLITVPDLQKVFGPDTLSNLNLWRKQYGN
jgi:hypothetical protein